MYIAESDTIDFMYQAQPQSFGEGLYFGLPEDIYHRIPAISSTGLKNLLVSAPDFYFNSELNPFREEDGEDEDAKEWRVFGKASHTRVLEGKKVFDSLYCVEYLAPEGCLDTVSDLKAWVASRGIDTKGLKSNAGNPPSKWGKSEWIEYVQSIDPNVLIFDVEQAKYFRETNGRIQMTQKDLRRIEIAAAMIEKHPELRYCFTGGFAEVTVIWKQVAIDHDGKSITLWFKARIDYLKPEAIVDLKTFTNMRNKPIDQALHDAVENMKYHVQTAFYTAAGIRAIGFARRGITTTYSVQRFGPTPEFLKELAASKGHTFMNVFQKKGGAPLARGKKFSQALRKFTEAQDYIELAIKLFCRYYQMFGTDIWVDVSSITEFVDDEFPARRINPF